MYLIDITIHESAATGDNSAQLLDEHRAWFGKYVDQGNFLLLGPYTSKTYAGVIIAQAQSREQIDSILAEDVYYPDKAVYTVEEFTASKIADDIQSYVGK